MAKTPIRLSGDKEADALLTKDPLALLIGMVLDQQIPLERAFWAPAELARRLGKPLDAEEIAAMDPDTFAELFKERPALHRYPGAMAGRVQAVCRIVAEDYGGKASNLWTKVPDADTLLKRLTALPGFGQQKARIFAALLGKQRGDSTRRLAHRHVTLRGGGVVSVRGRHHRAREPGQGPRTQASHEGKGKGRRRQSVTARRAITDCHLYLCTPDRPDLESFVASCIAGGVDIVQLREKHLDAKPLIERARLVRAVCLEHGVPFILNDRPDLALEVGADGVHVGQDDAPVALARRILGPDAIVGLSTHGATDLAEVVGPSGPDVSYISAGPVEATPTKPGRPGTGLGYLRMATEQSAVPVFVTGGVTPEKIPDLARAGARHFVVVRYLTEAGDPQRAARNLRRAIDDALASS